jgi:prevent-host-death family protein
MNRPLLDQDIHPLSEFRAKTTTFVQQVRRTHRPVIVTQRGKGAAVLMAVGDYESMLDKLELLQDVRDAEAQVDRGQGISQDTAKGRVFSRIPQ